MWCADGEVRFTNVFVKNLTETMTEEKLREMFSEHGEVPPSPGLCRHTANLHGWGKSLSSKPNSPEFVAKVLAVTYISCTLAMHFVHLLSEL